MIVPLVLYPKGHVGAREPSVGYHPDDQVVTPESKECCVNSRPSRYLRHGRHSRLCELPVKGPGDRNETPLRLQDPELKKSRF